MRWLEVTVHIKSEWQEEMSRFFAEEGIQSIEIVDPVAFRQVLKENCYLDYADDDFINSLGDQVVMKAYFHAEQDREELQNKLRKAFSRYGFTPSPEYTIRLREDSEWKDNWKKQYRTFQISNRVVIKPSWENFNPSKGKIVLELEPGMAFGTGTHETTRMCAVLLDEMVQGNERVLDLGCGTGILGMIAAKLGASEVTCVDIDASACGTARENVLKNGVDALVSVKQGELEDLATKEYDIIVINIIADVILFLLPKLKAYCGAGTKIILSGIIKQREPEILDTLTNQGYAVMQQMVDGEWVTLKICIDS